MSMRKSVLYKNAAAKNAAEQMDLGLPNHTSTPILRVVLTQMSTPIRPRRSIIQEKKEIEEVNDDASERRSITAAYNQTPNSSERNHEVRTMSFMRATFQNSVKLFYDDKITRDNVWNIELIDNMYTLVVKNDQSVDNFHVLSSALAASAKIYGLRVDSIHSDMLRLIIDINTESAKQKQTATDDAVPNNDDSHVNNNEEPVPKKDKRKKRKKNVESYLAQNDDMINGMPDLFECIDPAFQIRTATMGDATTLSNAFVRTLCLSFPNKLELGVTDDLLYKNSEADFDNKEACEASKIYVDDYGSTLCTYSETNNFKLLDWQSPTFDILLDENCALNKTQQDVMFLGDNDVEQPDIPMEHNEDDVENYLPVDSEDNYNISNYDNDSDIILVRHANRPGSGTSEFLSNITMRLWAGPHYLRKKMIKAVPGKNSEIVKRTRQKRPAVVVPQEVAENDKVFSKSKGIKLKRAILTQWSLNDATKQKFPEDLLLDVKEFENDYSDGKYKPVRFPRNDEHLNTTCVDDAVPPYDYNNEMDTDYCPMVQDERNRYSDDEDEGGQNNLNELDDPDMVDELNINYAKKAKTIDMKQLKRCIYTILKDKSKEGIKTIQFSEMCKILSKKLDSEQADQLTMQIALLALLFVVNERKLILEQTDSKDFTIFMN